MTTSSHPDNPPAVSGSPKSSRLQPRVLIAAGGTSGHVMPAQAVAQELRRRRPDIAVEFVCGMRPVELRAYWNASEQPHLLRCGSAAGGPLAVARRWGQLVRAYFPASQLIKRLQPSVVLGMGGYICAPILLAAHRHGIPIVLHESNSIPGRTIRLFARWAQQVLVAQEEAVRGLPSGVPVRITGTPVRPSLFGVSRTQGAAVFQLDPAVRTLLVLGGSLGARALNSTLLDSLKRLDELAVQSGGLQLLWSTGAFNHAAISMALEQRTFERLTVSLHPTITQMEAAYACADMVFSRAGAGTLAEITALGLPSILIPYPHAKDGHQRRNAQALADAGAARLVEESELSTDSFMAEISTLFTEREMMRAMARSARSLARPGAAAEVADILTDIVNAAALKPNSTLQPATA